MVLASLLVTDKEGRIIVTPCIIYVVFNITVWSLDYKVSNGREITNNE
jgi:hypothetical protein